MARLANPITKTITINSQYCPYFEVDAENYKIRVKAFDRDDSGNMVEGSLRTSEWISMLDENGNPNLPTEDLAVFANAMPLVVDLVVAFAKVGGVVDSSAFTTHE